MRQFLQMSDLRPYGEVMGVAAEGKSKFTSTARVPYPDDEVQRLKALRALCLLDSPPELVFDRLTRVAQHALKCPIALVSLVDAERQWFKSRQGLDASETPRDIAFCAHAILSDELFVVKNALEDPRFATNPLVCGELNIRFYAGRPLRAPSGHLIGTLCVIDRVPREPTPEDLHTLDDIAHLVEEQIDAAEVSQRLVRADVERRRFRALAECSPVGVFETDTEGACTYTNRRWQEITGLSGAAALGQGWLAAIYSEDLAQVQQAWQDAALRRGDFRRTFRFRRPSGEVRWVHVQASPVRNSNDEVIGWVGVDEDITDIRALQDALSESETRLKQLAQASDDVFWLMDANTRGLLYVSPAYERVWKRSAEAAMQSPAGWLGAVHPSDLARAKAALDQALQSGERFELELRILLPDGNVRHALGRGFPVFNTDGVVARLAGVVSDITSLHEAREELKHLASVDELTGVSNSRTFRELLAHEVHRATRNETTLSVAFIDIDHFKSVNDNFGHAAGDLVIKTVADVVRGSLRASDALARVGGDEFCILLPECDQAGAEKSLSEILRRLSATPISLGGQATSITLSIGIASAQGGSLSETELLERADAALYEAKYLGRNQVCRHDTLAPRSRDSRQVESSRRHPGGACPAPESTRATVATTGR